MSIEDSAAAAQKELATLSKLARHGKLNVGDTQMAELLTSPESASMEGMGGIKVSRVVFTRDASRVLHWDVSMCGLSSEEEYVGSIQFPPEYPKCAPVLIYSACSGKKVSLPSSLPPSPSHLSLSLCMCVCTY
jgi:hypothetical protein